MSPPLTKNPYTFHKYPNSANRNIKKAIKAIKILTFYQQRRTAWYHVCEKQQRSNSGHGWHFCHAQWTSNGYSYFRSSLTTSAFLYLKLPNRIFARVLQTSHRNGWFLFVKRTSYLGISFFSWFCGIGKLEEFPEDILSLRNLDVTDFL